MLGGRGRLVGLRFVVPVLFSRRLGFVIGRVLAGELVDVVTLAGKEENQ